MPIEFMTYDVSGEFGEFHPTAPDSGEERLLRVTTPEPSAPANQPSADVCVSIAVENAISLAIRMDHVITPFVEAASEAWTQARLVCRADSSKVPP